MVGLYLDEDQDPLVARTHRSTGYETVCAQDVGLRGATDEEQLAYASRAGRILVTSNVSDFATLHAQWQQEGRPHAGIIVLRQYKREEIGQLLRLLTNVLELATPEDVVDRLRFLSEFDV